MNIHPAFVHFPIALFTIYAVGELIWSQRLRMSESWIWFKTGLLTIGTLVSFIALQTGESAEHIMGRSDLIEMHSTFAAASVWIFAVLAVLYIVEVIQRGMISPSVLDFIQKNSITAWLWRILATIKGIVLESWFVYVVALAGLVCITITGALGGAIAYGPEVDPVVSFFYHLFF